MRKEAPPTAPPRAPARDPPALVHAPLQPRTKEEPWPPPQPSTPQVIGQAEHALGALMNRVLATTGGTFHQWVALNLAAVSGGTIGRDQLLGRMTGALKLDDATALAAVAELTAAQLLEALPGEEARVGLTDTGQARYRQLRTAIDQLTARLYGDLPADDLATATRVLAVITTRANAEVAGADHSTGPGQVLITDP